MWERKDVRRFCNYPESGTSTNLKYILVRKKACFVEDNHKKNAKSMYN